MINKSTFADNNLTMYETIVKFLCKCKQEKNLEMFIMFNLKRKQLLREEIKFTNGEMICLK
tara:strand:- start:1060 stop:1242 length:183 start_codon:yes stop_codon:yes gene_type:complete